MVPGWIFLLALIVLIASYSMISSQTYMETFRFLWPGVLTTVYISVVAYTIALIIGLGAGLGRISQNRGICYVSNVYVEVIRGIPMLVTVLYIGLVVIPLISRLLGLPRLNNLMRAILALAIANGAYLAEIIRAGIQAIGRGQTESALALGMTRLQAMRHIILPQAFQVVLPALGNEYILMLKDSSLASVLSVSELTFLGQLNASRTFDTFTTWNMVAFLYLMITLAFSFIVRLFERATARRL